MGELILCGPTAAAPFFIEEASLHINSLEELGYYMEQNYDVLGPEFMSEALVTWVEQELGLKDIAERLRKISMRSGLLPEFAVCLLSESAYCTGESLKQLEASLREVQGKSDFECGKIRADRHMANRNYLRAAGAYKRLLTEAENCEVNSMQCGNVWHNLGTAYARLFLFQEAVSCFRSAYGLNQNMESLRACLNACLCGKDEEEFERVSKENFLDEAEREEIKSIHSQAGKARKMQKLGTEPAEDDILGLVEEWKQDYRKYCRE